MKTIEQWLNELESPYREQALENAKNSLPDTRLQTVGRLATALAGAFVFEDTKQGFDYWNNLYDKLDKLFPIFTPSV